MRYLRFSIFLSAILVATGVFLPYVQLGIGGIVLGQKNSMTLYGAVNNYTFLENAAARVDASIAERIADGLLAQVEGKSSALSKPLREIQSTLRDVKQVREDAHLEQIGRALRVVGVTFLAVLVLVSWMVLKSMSQRRANRRRAVVVAVLMGLVGILGVGLFFAAREGLALANAEVGSSLLSMGSGSYVMLIGAALGAIAATVSVVLESRLAKAQAQAVQPLVPKDPPAAVAAATDGAPATPAPSGSPFARTIAGYAPPAPETSSPSPAPDDAQAENRSSLASE